MSQGIGESHIYIPDVADLTSIFPQVATLANLRTALNGDNVFSVQVRLSQIGRRRVTERLIANFEPHQLGAIIPVGGCAGFKSDIPNVCINVEWKSASGQRGMTHLAGIPDALIQMDPSGVFTQNVPGWLGKFNAWKTEMCNGSWGFEARVLVLNPPQILLWNNEAGAPFRLICTLAIADSFGAVGDKVQVRDALMNNRGLPSPNGQWIIEAISTSPTQANYTLRNSQGIAATDIYKPGTVEPVSEAIVAYARGEIIGQMTRKRGVGSIRARGRSSRRRRRWV